MEIECKEYKLEVEILSSKDPNIRNNYVSKLETEIKQLRTKISHIQGGAVKHPLFEIAEEIVPEGEDLGEIEKDAVIEIGDNLQELSLDFVNRMKVRVEETKNVAIQIERKVKEHYTLLEYIDIKNIEIDSTLKRVRRYIYYFTRAIFKDKVILGCIFLIVYTYYII